MVLILEEKIVMHCIPEQSNEAILINIQVVYNLHNASMFESV